MKNNEVKMLDQDFEELKSKIDSFKKSIEKIEDKINDIFFDNQLFEIESNIRFLSEHAERLQTNLIKLAKAKKRKENESE